MEKEDFSKRLIELRMSNGSSARGMSLSIGQNPNYISDIESCHAYPTMYKFFFICEYLGITPQEFFEVDTPDPKKASKLYHEARSLTSGQLDVLLAMVKEMKK